MCLAIPAKVIEIHGGADLLRTGKVDFGGVAREISLALVPEATVGDYVLIHVGMALSKIAEEEAHQVFAYLREMEPEEFP